MEIRINLFKKAIYFYYLTSIQGCQGTLCDIWYNALGNKISSSIKKWQILLKFLPTFSCHKSLWKYQISLDIHLTYSVSTLLEFLRPRKSYIMAVVLILYESPSHPNPNPKFLFWDLNFNKVFVAQLHSKPKILKLLEMASKTTRNCHHN